MRTDDIIGDLRVLVASQSGFDRADICARATEVKSIGAHQNRLEDFSYSMNWEIALRLQKGESCVVVSGSSPEKDFLKSLVDQATSLLRSARFGPTAKIRTIENDSDSMDEGPDQELEIPSEEKAQRVLNLVSNVSKGSTSPIEEVYGKYTEQKVSERYWSSGSNKSLYLVKKNFQIKTRTLARLKGREPFIEFYEDRAQYFDLDWSKLAKNSGLLAGRLANSSSLGAGSYRCLMDAPVVTKLLALLGQQLQGNRVARGLSCFKKDEIGKAIFSPKLTVLDDPRDFKRWGFRPFDAEGIATQRNIFIRSGVLESIALDAQAAEDLMLKPNGQAVRDNLLFHPQPGFHNLTIEPGTIDFVDLERELGKGIRLISVDSLELTQPRIGQFLASFSGFMMEKGQITQSLSRILVRGDLQNVFSNIIAVGRDLHFSGRCAAPAVLVDSMFVMGEQN